MTLQEILAEADKFVADMNTREGDITDDELKRLNYVYCDLMQGDDLRNALAPAGTSERHEQALATQARFQAINDMQTRRVRSGVRIWSGSEVEQRRHDHCLLTVGDKLRPLEKRCG